MSRSYNSRQSGALGTENQDARHLGLVLHVTQLLQHVSADRLRDNRCKGLWVVWFCLHADGVCACASRFCRAYRTACFEVVERVWFLFVLAVVSNMSASSQKRGPDTPGPEPDAQPEVKRGRGRPKGSYKVPQKPVDTGPKRPRGRPKGSTKKNSAGVEESTTPGEKRGRGRPKGSKNTPKRGPGRPRTIRQVSSNEESSGTETAEQAAPKEKRGRGRPKKAPEIEPSGAD